ncbi:cobalamin B12-binding domain-containing protein [Ectothiorhodospira sp. PHS-1]|nr:cobalamin B12-binding domain-containing protein [Ectothiorhodospira sp. PHS-1]
MTSLVSCAMARHPRRDEFSGGHGMRLLECNHRNHAAFMAEVLAANDFQLLAETLPWVYAAYHHQGVHFDYFPAQFEAWMQAIRLTLSEADAEHLLPVYRWMADIHPAIIKAALSHQARRLHVPERYREEYTYITTNLLQGNYPDITRRCRELLSRGMSYGEILQELFYPAMVDVGARWEDGEISVSMEHQATAMAYGILSSLYHDLPFPDIHRGHALVSPVSNEFHEMGAWMLATRMELDGWDITLLGGDTPREYLITTAVRQRPRFVALSVTLISNIHEARCTIEYLRQALGRDSTTRILVGGQAFLTAPRLAASLGADACLESCDAAVRWARTLESETDEPTST